MSSPKRKLVKSKELHHQLTGGAKSDSQAAMIEIIARAIIAEKGLVTRKGVENIVTKSTTEIKAQITAMEAKLVQLEASVTGVRNHVDESIQKLREDMNRKSDDKFLAVIAKVSKKQKDELESTKSEADKRIGNLEGEVAILNKNLLKLQDTLNEFQQRQTNEVDERINLLEESIDLGNINDIGGLPSSERSARSKLQLGSFQTRRPKSAPTAVSAAIRATFDRINAHDAEINELKQKNFNLSNEEDLKVLKRKLRSVVESTSSACRTVSNGIADVQDATLQIYTWAERVHSAIGVISEKVGVRPNICPRLQIVPSAPPHDAPYVPSSPSFAFASPQRNTPNHHHHPSGHHSHHHNSHHHGRRSHHNNDFENF